MRWSVDWTLEDMVDGLFFCARLTGRRGGHTHLYKQERKRPMPVQRWLSRAQAVLGRVIPGAGCRCRGWKCRVLWGCAPTSHSIGDPPSAPRACCGCQINWWIVMRRVQIGVSIWGAVYSRSIVRWALSGADVESYVKSYIKINMLKATHRFQWTRKEV